MRTIITKDREYRAFQFRAEEQEDAKTIEGQPVVFNEVTVLYEWGGVEYKEIIKDTAFQNADISDVVLNIDHEGKPAAKTKNQTLKLEVKSDGLHMNADLSKNATGRELFEDIRNGFYDKMSFAFTIADNGYEYDEKTHTRTITAIEKLYDVSAVTFPAYKQTSLSARSFFEAEAEKERKALENAELRKRLIIKTYL